eukprot:5813323-Prymnesium_polylepis.1
MKNRVLRLLLAFEVVVVLDLLQDIVAVCNVLFQQRGVDLHAPRHVQDDGRAAVDDVDVVANGTLQKRVQAGGTVLHQRVAGDPPSDTPGIPVVHHEQSRTVVAFWPGVCVQLL